jgi:hypothetical protein
MMRSITSHNALILILGLVALPAQAQAQSRIEAKLDTPVSLEKGIDANTPLKDVVEFLRDRYDISIVIDTQAFKAKGVEAVDESPTHLPKLLAVNLGTTLQVLVKQVNGTYEVKDKHVLIVPLDDEQKKQIKRPTSERQQQVEKELRDRLTQPVDFEQGIDARTTLKDALQFIRDRFDVNLVIDRRAFHVGKKSRDVASERVQLPKLKSVSLGTALRRLLKPIDADCEIIDNLILIVPQKSNARS